MSVYVYTCNHELDCPYRSVSRLKCTAEQHKAHQEFPTACAACKRPWVLQVRLTRAFLSFFEGGHLWQCPDDVASHGYGEAGQALVQKIVAGRTRRDGSVTLGLTAEEVRVVYSYAEAMATCAGDNVSHEPEALGELNAARALLRKIEVR